MKLKRLLLFLLVFGFCALVNATQKKPYNNLIITEARLNVPDYNFCEVTNMGTETIDLSEFKLESTYINTFEVNDLSSYVFPKVMLAPGKSYVIAAASDAEPRRWAIDVPNRAENTGGWGNRPWVQPLEMNNVVDAWIHMEEPGTPAVKDSVTPHYQVMVQWDGFAVWMLKHIYEIDGVQDSMIIDQVGGVFDTEEGTNYGHPYDVAGVKDATDRSILIRKASVTTGITEFSSHAANDAAAAMQFGNNRGLDLADSEWVPVLTLGGKYESRSRAVFWTLGNQGDYKLDANTLVPKIPGKITVDLAQSTITVPWGIRFNDAIMSQFEKKPGLAWTYEFAPTKEDSMYNSIRTGDKLILYVIGKEATIKTFSFVVSNPTPSDNIVIPKASVNYANWSVWRDWPVLAVTDGISGMDTISKIFYAYRIDSLYRYLEKAPKATWKIIPKDGNARPDLKNGDKLAVTSENGKVKEYFLKVTQYLPSINNALSSITWPDMPAFFKGDLAKFYGWKHDTIPGFNFGNNSYILKIPNAYDGIPGLQFSKQDLNSKVVVDRAKVLGGTLADATVTFTVTAEDGSINVYTVRFDKEQVRENVQPFIAEPYISQFQFLDRSLFNWCEIANPGTEPLDLSHYMIMASSVDLPVGFSRYQGVENYNREYMKYVPGKKWQNEAGWAVQPRILEPDLGTNAIVAPGDVFVLAPLDLSLDGDSYPGEIHWFQDQLDFNFMKTPWGGNYGNYPNAISAGDLGLTLGLFKIINDSVYNGLKPATNYNDFKLIDVMGTGQGTHWFVGGREIKKKGGFVRKPNVWKGNTEYNGSFGTTPENSEWTVWQIEDEKAKGYLNWPLYLYHQLDGMGSHVMDPVGVYKSTVTSLIYKVSPGYSQTETIKGLKTGTTVTEFYNNIVKADLNQSLKVKSASTGAFLADAAVINKGDILEVVSANTQNTSKYILDVTATGLSSNALLTSTKFTVNVTGSTGIIGGFKQGTTLKAVLAGVIVPAGASLTITDQNDAYMSLTKLNYDTAYVNVIATDKVYFEVIAENNITKVLYQLKPTTNPSDTYVTSDVYSVNQFASLIQLIPSGTTVTSLLNNVYPAPGATMVVFDKGGFVRTQGVIYRDDKLIVTAADGKTTKAYYFSMLNFLANTYLAYVISDDYQIDQVKRTIVGPLSSTTLGTFVAKLYPSFGAILKVLDKNGNVSNLADLSLGDQLLVTAADGKTTALYQIVVDITKAVDPLTQVIKMYPNPTSDGRVIVQGLAKGNRVRVFNAAGITLRDVIADTSTDYVSLASQPAGVYIFVISSGDQHINIQKIIKK
jgi:hypothetical protein